MKDLNFYNTVSVSTKAFAWAFISKVLQEYLFEWRPDSGQLRDGDNLEQKACQEEACLCNEAWGYQVL